MKAGWQTKTLGEVLQKTETVNPLQRPETEFDYIDVSSISNQTFQIEETQRLTGKDAPSRARRLVKSNDILFATVRPTLRRIAIVPSELDHQVCSTGYFVLRPKPELDYRFVFYFLFSEDFMGQMEKLQKGASYPAVTDGEVRMQTIPVPPLPEQRRLVALLDAAFAGIATAKANTEQTLQNARAVFDSHLEAVFSQQGAGWEENTLGEILSTLKNGLNCQQDKNGQGDKISRIESISNATFDVTKVGYAVLSENEKSRYRLQNGDILFSHINSAIHVGKTALFDISEPVYHGVNLLLMRPKPVLTSAYLGQALKFLFQSGYWRGVCKQSVNQASVNQQDIAKVHIQYPKSLSEQDSIVAKLDAIRKETQRLEALSRRKLAALDELTQALLHQAFAGEL